MCVVVVPPMVGIVSGVTINNMRHNRMLLLSQLNDVTILHLNASHVTHVLGVLKKLSDAHSNLQHQGR